MIIIVIALVIAVLYLLFKVDAISSRVDAINEPYGVLYWIREDMKTLRKRFAEGGGFTKLLLETLGFEHVPEKTEEVHEVKVTPAKLVKAKKSKSR